MLDIWLFLCEPEEPRSASTPAIKLVYSNVVGQRSILITQQRDGFMKGHFTDKVVLDSCMKTPRQLVNGITAYGKSVIVVDERNRR